MILDLSKNFPTIIKMLINLPRFVKKVIKNNVKNVF